MIQEAYVQGISTRSMDGLIKSLGMAGVSKSQASRLCGELDERVNGFLERGILPNDAFIVCLVGAMLLEQNDEWSLNRRYMQLEGLQTLTDSAPTRLSAVAR